MSLAVAQSYEDHSRVVSGYHRVTFLVLLVAVVWSVVQLFRQRFSAASVFGVLVVIVLSQLFYYVRAFAVRNQDRIIRLEMKLRMERLLPADLAARLGEFSTRQLVALRFAGDAELPALARRVLDEKIEDQQLIKRSIKDWQADHQRV
jgi:hypothetical protein